jgi:hypothetical protein
MKSQKKTNHYLQWFIDRIGKRVFRDSVTCTCTVCTHVEKEGLIINDKEHADYLFNVQLDMGIHYYDKKK